MEAPDSLETFDEVYMVSPLFDKDLCKIIESSVELTDEHIRYFIYQILCALKYLHSASVMHRDLKPANILVKESCDIALCDFGLARSVEDGGGGQGQDGDGGGLAECMTEYVVTRWYRAPELVLVHDYSNAVDLWAVGCIMGDLFGRKVMFPGKDFKHQVEIICSVLGKPSLEDMAHVTSGRARKFIEKLPSYDPIPLKSLFPTAPDDALDLMKKLLHFNPNKRLTAEQALLHPFVQEFHDPAFEGSAPGSLYTAGIEPRGRNGNDLTIEDIRHMMLREIYKFRPNADLFKNLPEVVQKE